MKLLATHSPIKDKTANIQDILSCEGLVSAHKAYSLYAEGSDGVVEAQDGLKCEHL